MNRYSHSATSSEITSEHAYLRTRRNMVGGMGAIALGGITWPALPEQTPNASLIESNFAKLPATPNRVYPSGAVLSAWNEVASYVLYHEFGESAEEAVRKIANVSIEPWSISLGGSTQPRILLSH